MTSHQQFELSKVFGNIYTVLLVFLKNTPVYRLFLLLVSLLLIFKLDTMGFNQSQEIFKLHEAKSEFSYLSYFFKSACIFMAQNIIITFYDFIFAGANKLFYTNTLTRFLNLPYKIFKSVPLGVICSSQYFISDASSCLSYAIFYDLPRSINGVFIPIIFVYDLGLWKLSLIALTSAFAIIIIFCYLIKIQNKYAVTALQSKLKSIDTLRHEFYNFESTKAMGLEKTSLKHVKSGFRNRFDAQIRFDISKKTSSWIYQLFEPVIVLSLFILRFYDNEVANQMAAKDLTTLGLIYGIVKVYESARTIIQTLEACLSSSLEIIANDIKSQDNKISVISPESIDKIQFVVNDLIINLRPNEKLAVYSNNAEDMPEIMNQIFGLVDGSIRLSVNGIPIQDVEKSWIIKNVTLVTKEVYYSEGTVMRNLQYGNNKTEEEIKSICQNYNVDSILLKDLPDGYSRFSSMGGDDLSGGQRQKIHFLRGAIRDSEILLIEDCLKGVSTVDRAILAKALLKNFKKTLIYSTDNDSILKYFDKIVYISDDSVKLLSSKDLSTIINE